MEIENQKRKIRIHLDDEPDSQEIVVGAKGDEIVDLFDEGAAKDGPLAAEKREHNHRRHNSMDDQHPLHLHELALEVVNDSMEEKEREREMGSIYIV